MKKVIALLLAVVSLALCMTGCVYEEIGVKLNKNGTGSISTVIGLKKDFVKQLSKMGGSDPFEGKETTETEYDGEKYITYTETKEYASFEEMEKVLSELTYDTNDYKTKATVIPTTVDINDSDETNDDSESENDTGYQPVSTETPNPVFKSARIEKNGSTYVFDAVLNAVEGEIEGYDMSDVLKVSVSVEMPGKITKYKSGKVDGKRIVYDLKDMTKETALYAECKVSSPVPAIIGIVLAVGAVVAFIILKKKK